MAKEIFISNPDVTEVSTPTSTEVSTPTSTEVSTPTSTEVPTSTATEVSTSTSTEVPTSTATEAPEMLSVDKAAELVRVLLDSSDVVKAFNALQTIEKKYKANALPENIKNIYEKARNDVLNQLKNDPVIKQLGMTLALDTNSNIGEEIPLFGLSKEMADLIVLKILGNPDELIKQNNEIMRVENNISILNEPQRKYYEGVKREIKNNPDWKKIIQEKAV